MKITIRTPTEDDIQYLAANMRQCDIDEILATHGQTPIDAIRQSIANSPADFVYAAHVDGVLACMGGAAVDSLLSDTCRPWLLGTTSLRRYNKSFTRGGRRVVRMMLNRWRILTNIVDARNAVSIRWLGALGFVFGEPYQNERGYTVMRFHHEKCFFDRQRRRITDCV